MESFNLEPLESPARELVETIQVNKYTNQDLVFKASRELMEIAKSQERVDLYGFALFHLAYAYYNIDDITQAYIIFEKALKPLQESGQWELVARDYCAMGILSNSQGNAPMAMDYYLRGISVCESHEVITAHAVIDCNIGILYLSYHDFQNAEFYFQRCIDCVETVRQVQGDYIPSFTYPTVATFYFNKANIAIILGNVKDAIENLQKAAHLEQKSPDPALNLAMKMLKAQILYMKGNQKELDKCIKEIDESDLYCGAITDAFDDFITYASFLQSIGKEEEFFHAIARMEEAVRIANSVFLRRRLVQLKIRFYKENQQNKEYLMEAGLFYELSERMEEELEKSYRESMSTRVNLEKEKRTKEVLKTEAATLKIKSEQDALTGLHNRYKISEISESSFSKCVQEHKPLAVEILDIDYFKQYNDNYGHPEGDNVLVKVAYAVHSLEKYPGVFTGRYGGDEFIVIYVDHTYDEVADMAQELKDAVKKENILHEYSPIEDRITISQGLYFGAPGEHGKFWDFLHAADQALYEVKKAGRNDFCVSTKLSKERS